MSIRMGALLLLASLLAAAGQVLFKLAATGRDSFAEYLNPWMLGGFFCYASGAVLWIYCLSSMPLVKVYPFTALVFVLAVLAGVFLFGEATGVRYWYGMGFILVGLFLVMS